MQIAGIRPVNANRLSLRDAGQARSPLNDADEQIGPTARRLAQRSDADSTRPTLQYYRRHDIIDVLVPVV